MNEKYKNLIKGTNKSLRKISLETGIPYTILNELNNEKKNINHIASETVYKLCLYFGCETKDLLNPFPILKNSQGTYMGVTYKWLPFQNGAELHIYQDEKDVLLTTVSPMIPKFYSYYKLVMEMLIEKYLKQKHAEEALV